MSLVGALKSNLPAIAFTLAAGVIAVVSGSIFVSMSDPEPIVAGAGVTRQRMLSEFNPNLSGSAGDTPVYELGAEKPGGSILILGGTQQ